MSILDNKELTCAEPEPLSPRCVGPYPQSVCDGCEAWAQCDADAPFPRLEDDPTLLPGDYLPVEKLVKVDLCVNCSELGACDMSSCSEESDDDIDWIEDDCPWCDEEDDWDDEVV